MTNSDRLQEIRERAEKATEGPWRFWPQAGEESKRLRVGPEGPRGYDLYTTATDARFIAASREDVPWLLQLVTEQQNEIAWLRTWIFQLQPDHELVAQKLHDLTGDEERMTIDQVRDYLGIKP